MDAALRNVLAFTGCSLAEALETITSTPADLLGMGQLRGRIIPGAYADLVMLTPDLQVSLTMVEGKTLYRL